MKAKILATILFGSLSLGIALSQTNARKNTEWYRNTEIYRKFAETSQTLPEYQGVRRIVLNEKPGIYKVYIKYTDGNKNGKADSGDRLELEVLRRPSKEDPYVVENFQDIGLDGLDFYHADYHDEKGGEVCVDSHVTVLSKKEKQKAATRYADLVEYLISKIR